MKLKTKRLIKFPEETYFELNGMPYFNTNQLTNFDGAWRGNNFKCFPLLDTSNGVNFYEAWYYSPVLMQIPKLNTSKGTTFEGAWGFCSSLTEFPLIDVSNGIDFNNAWTDCIKLVKFPKLDTSNGIHFSETWDGCSGLIRFPPLDSSNGVGFSHTWSSCKSLIEFPNINMENGVSFDFTWSNCRSLTHFPKIPFLNGKTFYHSWCGCKKLEHFPPNVFDKLYGTMYDNAFYGTWSRCNLTTESIENILVSINVANIIPHGNKNIISIGTNRYTKLTNETYEAIQSLKNKNWIVEIE